MKISNKTLISASLLFLVLNPLSAFEKIPASELLEGYLQNDSTLKNLAIEVQKAQLSQNTSQISNGFDISLSTGQMSLSFSDSDQVLFSLKPSVDVLLPQFRNLGISISGEVDNKSDGKSSDDNSVKFSTSISLSADIISNHKTEREISLLKAERKVLEAKRRMEISALTVESAFYKNIENLLKSTAGIISQENSLYSDQKEFETVKARGYSTGSSAYRLAEMKVVSDLHSIEANKRALIHDYIVFYKKCGFDIKLEMNQDFMELIPSDIQTVELLNVLDFDKSLYEKIENAEWTIQINKMERNSKSDFELKANAGYTLKNNITGTDTIDVGVTSSVNGITFRPAVNFPVGAENSKPSATLSVTFNPNTMKKNQISSATEKLSEEQEKLNLESAYVEYDEKMVELIQEKEDLEWTKKSNEESFVMYEALEKDLRSWFNQGIIPETEYLSAKKNMQNYKVQKIINELDAIIYNNSVRSQFVSDGR